MKLKKRALPTALILLAMAAFGVAYWLDLSWFTSPTTGFVEQGSVWLRYLLLVVPVGLALLGLKSVGSYAIAVVRLRNNWLALLCILAGIAGAAYGVTCLVDAVRLLSVYLGALGALMCWYGFWMFRAARQLIGQRAPSPTRSALWGLLAALPFCLQTMYRVLVNPTSLYRVSNLVRIFSALFVMLWMGMLLRAFYIALVRRRVRWMYLIGIMAFLFSTCFEMVQVVHTAVYSGVELRPLMEAVNMGMVGLLAGCVSVSISAQDQASAENASLVGHLPVPRLPRFRKHANRRAKK